MRKGVFTLMIAVCLLLAFPVAAKAQPFVEQEKLPGGIVVPMWDYMNDINTTLSISICRGAYSIHATYYIC